MQKWEYQFIQIDFVSNPRSFAVNVKASAIPNLPSRNHDFAEVEHFVLSRAGIEGWELVSTLQRGMFYFKRPQN
jgi:hypothetical protein